MKSVKELIISRTEDLVAGLLYYDRKEDEELRPDDVKRAIDSGEVTLGDIAKAFKKELKRSFSR